MPITDQPTAPRTRPTWGSALSFGYGVAGYLAFVAASLYGVAFLADVWVPRTVDHGGPDAGLAAAAVVDALLLSVFAVTHSVMARPEFKRRWRGLVPAHLERSTYVLVASASLALAFWQWRPIPHVAWDMSPSAARVLVWTLYGLGWAWVLAMTFAIDHLDLLGLRQIGRHLRGLAERPSAFAVPWPHRLVRHPMMLGFFVAFLAAPTMTVGHLIFAALGCGYILVGVRFEERDLVEALPEYAAYAAATPRFVPRGRSRSQSDGSPA
jgi:methanethiol S-methyltransferase